MSGPTPNNHNRKTPSVVIVIDDNSIQESAATPPVLSSQQQQQQQQQQPLVAAAAAMSAIASPLVVINPYKRTVSSSVSSVSAMSVSSSNASQSHRNTSTKTTASSLSTTATTTKSTMNPYQTKKFLGGAELARRMARSKNRGTRILCPGEEEKQKEEDVLPKNMNSFEKFFAAALRSPPQDFLDAADSNNHAYSLWQRMCARVRLEVPSQPVQPSYDTAAPHLAVRAALVLEEARHALSTGLAQVWQRQKSPQRSMTTSSSGSTMLVRAHLVEMIPHSRPHSKMTFFNPAAFTKDQLFHIRPGTVFYCHNRESPGSDLRHVVLGVVATANRDVIEQKHLFQVVVFCTPVVSVAEDSEWVVTPMANLLTELRCFEALTTTSEIAFMNDLLGRQRATHLRFDPDDHDNNDIDDDPTKKKATISVRDKATSSSSSSCSTMDSFVVVIQPAAAASNRMFRLPTLNATQQEAATAFLEGPANTITLVQGPPGTGKTTLLVSIICRYLQESVELSLSSSDENNNNKAPPRRRRLLVCAPTNKAVSVLASRFLRAMNQDTCPCNVILAGDADKLLGDDTTQRSFSYSNNNNNTHNNNPHEPDQLSTSRSLRSIFLYSWLQVVVTEYRTIQNYFILGHTQRGLSPSDLYTTAVRLEQRLLHSLTDLPKPLRQAAKGVTAALQSIQSGNHGNRSTVADKIAKLLDMLQTIPNDSIWKELMRSADVIFCTLASAGGMVFRKTCRVDDLIVDEAAAATEPELYIPFHLKPSRLLAVGDPKQLPATVLSRRAVDLGLAKSLHERLMYDCHFDHVMLDVQYRMSPAISAFPSQRFYESKIANGPNVSTKLYRRGPRLLDQMPYTFLQVNGAQEQGAGGSYRNHSEAMAVVELVGHLQSLRRTGDDSAWYSADRVRIITFYQAQVSLIKSLLVKEQQQRGNKIVVATVDSSQGCEADVVIVSFVRSPNNNSKGHTNKSLNQHDAGFLTDDRRMNVALTRAKYQLICVGNVHAMKQMAGAATLQLLAEDAEQRGAVRPYLTPRRHNDAVNTTLDLFYGPPQKKPKT